MDITANMTKEQRYFHYFNMYDLNKDGRLDGIEVWKALTHMHVGEGLFAFVFSFNCICYIVYSLKRYASRNCAITRIKFVTSWQRDSAVFFFGTKK